ncbi:MAG: zinc metallopeptidase [Pseudolabrys sp.]|nr:zinc metallopeptidase [Pseudolabrys sp.]
MRWDDFRQSSNVEDYRGEEGGGGGGFGIPVGGGLGIGTVVVLGLIGWALGIDPSILIGGAEILTGNGGMQPRYEQPTQRAPTRTGAPSDEAGQFVAAVLGNTEDTWQTIFQERGATYRPPRLRLFTQAIQGGCGMAQSAMGPFYCPNDKRIYLDTSFFQEIERRFKGCTGNACKFSQAYVIAHEVGHHVQNLIGTLPKARAAQEAAGGRAQANHIQVMVELQADCYAGVWANRSNARKSFIDPGDVDAALQTASAIGDDTLQRKAQGRVVPDAFTHGSSEQRKRWFSTGFQQGKLEACDTFRAANL